MVETVTRRDPDISAEVVQQLHPVERTFQTAHVLEILEDARKALSLAQFDATISMTTDSAVSAISATDISDMQHQLRHDEGKIVKRGVIRYSSNGIVHEKGIEAFEDNTLRVVANEGGRWVSLKEAHQAGSIEHILYTRIGDAVIRILDGNWQEGRVAQVQLGRQLGGVLPVSLPDYANRYLPTT